MARRRRRGHALRRRYGRHARPGERSIDEMIANAERPTVYAPPMTMREMLEDDARRLRRLRAPAPIVRMPKKMKGRIKR